MEGNFYPVILIDGLGIFFPHYFVMKDNTLLEKIKELRALRKSNLVERQLSETVCFSNTGME